MITLRSIFTKCLKEHELAIYLIWKITAIMYTSYVIIYVTLAGKVDERTNEQHENIMFR